MNTEALGQGYAIPDGLSTWVAEPGGRAFRVSPKPGLPVVWVERPASSIEPSIGRCRCET